MNPDTRGLGLAPATAADYRELARQRLPRQFFDYIDGAAYDEVTAGENLRGFQSLALRQRVLRDVSSLRLSTRVLGQELAMPVVLAPIGIAGAFARRAEVQAARAAEAAGIPFCESTVSICSIEEVRAATAAPFWYQLYVMRDRGYARELMQRAHAAACPVLVLTVDLAVMGARYRDIRNGMAGGTSAGGKLRKALDILSHPGWLLDVAIKGKPLTFGNLTRAVPDARSLPEFKAWVDSQFDPAVTWDDIAWVRENWPGRILLKGVLDVEDARQAAAVGADGIVVSNHGGRQLDGVEAEHPPPCRVSPMPSAIASTC
jgi:L-lactate dehydrogenase (cytochrome)